MNIAMCIVIGILPSFLFGVWIARRRKAALVRPTDENING